MISDNPNRNLCSILYGLLCLQTNLFIKGLGSCNNYFDMVINLCYGVAAESSPSTMAACGKEGERRRIKDASNWASDF